MRDRRFDELSDSNSAISFRVGSADASKHPRFRERLRKAFGAMNRDYFHSLAILTQVRPFVKANLPVLGQPWAAIAFIPIGKIVQKSFHKKSLASRQGRLQAFRSPDLRNRIWSDFIRPLVVAEFDQQVAGVGLEKVGNCVNELCGRDCRCLRLCGKGWGGVQVCSPQR